MSNLINQTCEACEIGAPLVSEGDQAKLLEGLDGWEIDSTKISKLVKKLSDKTSLFQTGFIYDYAFAMLIGLSILLTYLILN